MFAKSDVEFYKWWYYTIWDLRSWSGGIWMCSNMTVHDNTTREDEIIRHMDPIKILPLISLRSWNATMYVPIAKHIDDITMVYSFVKILHCIKRVLLHQIWECAGLTLTPSPPFSFLAYLLGKGGVKKWGFPLGFEPGTPRTTMHCSPMARHPGVAARAAISFPYETRFYDVIGLSAFSSLPLVGFCWTVDG